jgi:hypothetical protein
MLRWDAQLEDANQQRAELEDRISALKQELEVAQWAADAARVQRILAVREQQLDHLNSGCGLSRRRRLPGAIGKQSRYPIPSLR